MCAFSLPFLPVQQGSRKTSSLCLASTLHRKEQVGLVGISSASMYCSGAFAVPYRPRLRVPAYDCYPRPGPVLVALQAFCFTARVEQ